MPEDNHTDYTTFEGIKARLEYIVDAVSDNSISLDEALALYEEAVNLGLLASNILEEDTGEDAGTPCAAEGAAGAAVQDTGAHDARTQVNDMDVDANTDKNR